MVIINCLKIKTLQQTNTDFALIFKFDILK